MKLNNLTPRVKTNICFALLLLAASFISSCQKYASPAPDANLAANVSNNNLTSLATTTSKYKLTAPIYLINASNITISGDSINGGNNICVTLINCNNIHITNSKLMNSPGQRGVSIYNCKNVTVDYCYVSNVATGVYAHTSTGVRVMNNQFLNMKGTYGCFVQFDGVYGAGNRICYNKCENVDGIANANIGDGINLYQSNGLATDQIYVLGNWIRGGGHNASMGFSGIVLGDLGGSYQDVEGNILVNTGFVGIQTQGGTHLTVKSNKIYSDKLAWSCVGLASKNYSSSASNNNTITGNTVNWKAGYLNQGQRDTTFSAAKSNVMPTGWKVNTVKAAITSAILPAKMIVQPY